LGQEYGIPASLEELPKNQFKAQLLSFLIDILKQYDDKIDTP